MLSDEEKKAIKYIKNILNYEKLYYHDGIETNFLRPIDKENVKTALNLIEKQSKEIEELKKEYERVRAGRNWLSEHISAQIATPELFDKLVEENYISKDKIKAKIEEEDKLFFKTKDVRHANRYKAYKELLEKE